MAFADAQKDCTILQGIAPLEITLAGTVTKGDILGYSSGWVRALATVGTAIQGRLVAGESGVSGDVITAYALAVVGGSRYSGATAGNAIYVAEGTDNGKVTETAPATTGDVNNIIGRALSATVLVLAPALRGNDSVA